MDDGSILYAENVTHEFTNAGSYTITLTVTDNDGIPDIYYETINVMSSLPTANFVYEPVNPDANATVYFNSTAFSPVGTIVNWSWNFGDGNLSYGEFVTHQYGSNGSYSVNHTVIDNNGFTDSIIKTVIVGPLSETPLYTGWNLITVPIENDWMASTLAENISGCQMISWFDAENQTYKTHIIGVPGYDFEIQDGYGLFILVDQSGNLTMSGVSLSYVTVPLSVGWNMIGWYHYYDTTASSLAGNISGCQMVSWFDAGNQTFKTHIVGVPGYDFTITRGMGLFVLVDAASVWYGDG
jgi:PKD repeat protein